MKETYHHHQKLKRNTQERKCVETGNYLSEAEIEGSLKYSQELWSNTVHSGYLNSGHSDARIV